MDAQLINDLIVFALVVGLVLFVATMLAAAILVKPYQLPPFEPNDDQRVVVSSAVELNIKTSNKSADAFIALIP